MSAGLVWGLVGLALLDSLNTSTLLLVVVVLLLARRPVLSAWLYLAGAVGSFLAISLALYLGAVGAAEAFTDGAVLVRRVALGVAAVFLLVLAVRRLRDRPRALALPAWFSPPTAAVVGVLATLADLPTAFPLFIAVERLTAAGTGQGTGVLALVGYTAVYALPAVLALVAGTLFRERLLGAMRWVHAQVAGGTTGRSVPTAVAFAVAAGVAGAFAVLL